MAAFLRSPAAARRPGACAAPGQSYAREIFKTRIEIKTSLADMKFKKRDMKMHWLFSNCFTNSTISNKFIDLPIQRCSFCGQRNVHKNINHLIADYI